MMPCLHIPLDFAHRDEVRMMARAVPGGEAYVLRFWLDWARTGGAVREFKNPATAAAIAQKTGCSAWQEENLAVLIEDFAGWLGLRGQLMEHALASGVFRVAAGGIELAGFAEFNTHLAPRFESQYAKGAKRKAQLRRLREIGALVPKQLHLVAASAPGSLPAAEEHEQRRALGLVMNVDAACGREPRRPGDYPAALLRSALELIRARTEESLGEMILSIAELRGDPTANLDPDTIIHRAAADLQLAA